MESLVEKRLFEDKCCLITGASGFKGRWLSLLLEALGARVVGLDICAHDRAVFEAPQSMDFRLVDIRDTEALRDVITQTKPDIIIHLAAQSLVSISYTDIQSTYSHNVMGTLSLFEAVRHQDYVPLVLNITTDKVYHNKEWHHPYRENDELGGIDPYSASKSCVEIMSKSYFQSMLSNDHTVINLRAGNIIGGGDWSQNRLVPDIFRALEKKETLIIRHPSATRPWQHVLDPLLAYLQIATHFIEQKKTGYHSYNIGPNANGHKKVGTLLDEFKKHVAFDYQVDVNTNIGYESGLLSLETSKVAHEIGWQPAIEFSDAVKLTAECYMQASDAKHTMEVMRQQISYYAR